MWSPHSWGGDGPRSETLGQCARGSTCSIRSTATSFWPSAFGPRDPSFPRPGISARGTVKSARSTGSPTDFRNYGDMARAGTQAQRLTKRTSPPSSGSIARRRVLASAGHRSSRSRPRCNGRSNGTDPFAMETICASSPVLRSSATSNCRSDERPVLQVLRCRAAEYVLRFGHVTLVECLSRAGTAAGNGSVLPAARLRLRRLSPSPAARVREPGAHLLGLCVLFLLLGHLAGALRSLCDEGHTAVQSGTSTPRCRDCEQ